MVKLKEYSSQKISIHWDSEVSGRGKTKVDALVHVSGCFAINNFINDPKAKLLAVTHVGTGLRVMKCKSMGIARYVVSQLLTVGESHWEFKKLTEKIRNSHKSKRCIKFLVAMQISQDLNQEKGLWPKVR